MILSYKFTEKETGFLEYGNMKFRIERREVQGDLPLYRFYTFIEGWSKSSEGWDVKERLVCLGLPDEELPKELRMAKE